MLHPPFIRYNQIDIALEAIPKLFCGVYFADFVGKINTTSNIFGIDTYLFSGGDMSNAKIDHLIVLMLENRAFDHMLGYLDYPAETPFEGIAGKEKDFGNPYGDGQTAYPRPLAKYAIDPGPSHIHPSVMTQLLQNNPRHAPYQLTNRGFAQDYAQIAPDHPSDALNCFRPEHLPVLSALAQGFAVCDHWFCSVPGETWPNRNYAHSATSDGEVAIVFRTYPNKTIFQQLGEHERDWTIYYGGFPPQSIVFKNLWTGHDHRWMQRFKPIQDLYRAISTGHLPHYAFLEPDMLGRNSDSQHPSMGGWNDFRAGERLIWQVYHALRQNPEVFQKTLLLITYDEHGGFFDHVHPPQGDYLKVDPPYQNPDKPSESFPFDLLGPRVPAVLVSPWIAAGTVDQTVYEHSSIPATIRKLFNVDVPALTPRDAQVNTFEGILNLNQPRAAGDLPNPDEPSVNDAERKSKKGVPLRESLAWVLSGMIWQEMQEERREIPDKFHHLAKSLNTTQQPDQNPLIQGLTSMLDEISPQLSDDARGIFQDISNELEQLANAFNQAAGDVIDALPLADILKDIEDKLSKMLGEETLEDDAQKLGEWLFHLFDNPIVLLHTSDGRAIQQPTSADFTDALHKLHDESRQGAKLWLADHADRWLDICADDSATFYDCKPEKVRRLKNVSSDQQLQMMEDFNANDLKALRKLFGS